jgi:hypothetical protein
MKHLCSICVYNNETVKEGVNSMMRFLPAQRSKNWLLWMINYGILLTLALWLNRFVVLHESFSTQPALRFLILAFGLSIIVNGFGWLGARWVWLLTTIGILAGWGLMFYYASREMNGWGDLASFLGFAEGVAFGFGLGLLVEGVYFILKARKR